MFQNISYTYNKYHSCIVLTHEQAATILTPAEIEAGEKRGKYTHTGPWQIPVSYRAIAIDCDAQVIYGSRSLCNVKDLGYELGGQVSINGRKHRGFTGNVLIELPDGKLINLAVIHVC